MVQLLTPAARHSGRSEVLSLGEEIVSTWKKLTGPGRVNPEWPIGAASDNLGLRETDGNLAPQHITGTTLITKLETLEFH